MQTLTIKLFTVFAFSAALLLQGCGWHLRGTGGQPLPAELQTLYLETAHKNSSFSRSLKRSFKSLDIELVTAAADAPYHLTVTNIKKTKRTLSTTSNARVAEYEITSSITFFLKNQAGEQLLPNTVLVTERSYLYNRDNATSAFEEENLLRKEMERDLIQQLIRRYRAFKPTTTTADNH